MNQRLSISTINILSFRGHYMLTETYFEQLLRRPRRNRIHPAVRGLIRETRLHAEDFVLPLFIREGNGQREPILSMPNVFRLTPDQALKEIEKACALGISSVLLFPVVPEQERSPYGDAAIREDNLINRTLQMIKKEFPHVCVMVDIALDPYTTHGHDGVVNDNGYVMNDETIAVLGRMALAAASAGADIVAPSDMMDGRVGYIRRLLDQHAQQHVGILSYAAKYASGFYGPFREALHSAPKFGDKKSYQMDPANVREALLESLLDEQEGADLLLVKPALPYLDVLGKIRAQSHLPVGAYQVSGEYAMVMAATQNGWIDGPRVMEECLLAIKRAGADFIVTYAAIQIAERMN